MDPYSPPHYKTNETDRNNMESKNKRERESEKEGEGDSSWKIFPNLETLKPIRCKKPSEKPERKDDKLRRGWRKETLNR